MQSKTKVMPETIFSRALYPGLQISAGAEAKKFFIFSTIETIIKPFSKPD